MVLGIDSSVLLSYYQSRSGGQTTVSGGTQSSSGSAVKYAPTPPFAANSGAARESALVKAALNGAKLIKEQDVQLDLPGASDDYRKLFTLYQAFNSLYGLAAKVDDKGISDTDKAKVQTTFAKGLAEVTSYADGLNLEKIRLTRGDATVLTDRSAVGAAKPATSYTTRTLFTGESTDLPPAFQGAVAFNIHVAKTNSSQDVAIDLSELGSTPRTLSNVTSYLNSKLSADGLRTRFQIVRTPAEAKTVQAGGKTVTLPSTGDNFSLKLISDSSEKITLSDPAATPAVYVTSHAGNPDPDKNTKTDDGVFENALIKVDPQGGAGTAGAKLFTKTFDGTVSAVRSTQVGADGSVYLLANLTGTTNGESIKGSQDVAVLKYDSAGNLLYQRTLGAVSQADGVALAVASDGRVAVAGSVTGGLLGSTDGAFNSTAKSGLSDSFLTVFDAKGEELFTQRNGSAKADQATAVAFGADGVVYVAGQTQSALPGQTAKGGNDSYLRAVAADAKGVPKTLFTQQFGTVGEDKPSGIVVNGSQVIVGGIETYHGVLRSFDVTPTTVTTTTGAVYTASATATVGAVRDLGDLQGGALAGLTLDSGTLVVGGDTRNGALSLGAITSAYSGGKDAFAARLSTDLTNTSSDALAYFGGAGDDTVSGVAAAGGQIYLAGKAGAGLPGLQVIGTQNGFVARIDPATGVVSNVKNIGGKDGIAEVATLAVGATGTSALDRFGLPQGLIAYNTSPTIVGNSSARAGDQLQVRTKEGGALTTVTLTASDTIDTLAKKLSKAAGFRAKVEVVSTPTSRLLKISPATDGSSVELLPGKAGADLLSALGLPSGVVRKTVLNKDGKSVSADGNGQVYALGLPNSLDLSTTDHSKAARDKLTAAIGQIRKAYSDLAAAASPKPTPSTADYAGQAPAYLKAQVANYQAALNRLTGGG